MSRRLPSTEAWACPVGVALACLLLLGACADALANVSILPRLQEVEAARGQRKHLDFRIANHFDKPLSMVMKIAALQISVDGLPSGVPDSVGRGCNDWLRFEPRAFEIPPGGTQLVQADLAIPIDAVGTYGAFITAHYTLSEEEINFELDGPQRTVVDLSMAVSSVLLTTVRTRECRAEVAPEPFTIINGAVGGADGPDPVFGSSDAVDPWQIAIPVRNDGNTMSVVAGEVRIYRPGPEIVDSASLEAGRGYLLPGCKRILTARGRRVLDDGEYVAGITIQQRQGRPTQGHFPFHVVDGEARPGEASEELRQIISGLTPKIELSRRWLDLGLTPAARRNSGMRVTNHGADTLVVRPRLLEFQIGLDGRVHLDATPTSPRSCRPWIEVEPDSLLLAPSRGGSIRLSVTAPESLSGEYYAAVGFVEDGVDWSALSPQMRQWRSLIITARDERSAVVQAEIDTVRCRPFGPINRVIEADVANGGNVHCFARGRVEVYDANWNPVLEFVEFGGDRAVIMPGARRRFEVPCPGALAPGRYKAVVQVVYDDQEKPLVYEHWFTHAGE